MAEREYIEVIAFVSGENKVEQLNKKVDNLGKEAKETGQEIDKFSGNLGKTGTATISLKDKIKQLADNFKVLHKESDNSSTTLMNSIKKYAGITAIGVGIKQATSVFTAFDDEIRKVQATSGATAEEMENLRNQAKELGRTTRWSASEAAEAQFEFAKAGFEANEIYNATPGILNTATAGQLSLAEATEITAGTLRMFKLNASQSQRVGDVLAQTANASTTDIRGLGESLKYAGLGATDFGLSLEQTLAILGTLGNNKIDSSMAGTGLRSVFSAFKDKNKAKLLINAGIQLTEDGSYRNFLKILDDIKVKTANMEGAQRLSFMRDVFGEQGELVMSALFKTSGKDFDNLLKKIEDSKGYSQKVAEIFDSGLGGSFKNLQSAVEGFSISLIENLAPTFITVTNAVTKVINVFTTFFEWLNNGSLGADILSGTITGLSAIYTAHVITLKAVALWTMINEAYKKSEMAQTVISTGVHYAHSIALGVVTVATKAAAIGTWALNTALAVLTAPVLLVIAAGVGLGAIFYDLYKRSETFRKGVQWLIGELKTLWGYIKKFTGLGVVIDVGKSAVNGIKELFGFGDKKKTVQEAVKDEKKKNTTLTDNSTQKSIKTGENTDYLFLNSTKRETNNYKHNGYYLKGTKNISNTYNNSTLNNAVENYNNSISNNTSDNYNFSNDTSNNKHYTNSNIYSEYTSTENNVPEKTMEEKILDTLLSIKELLSNKNSDSSKININITKNDKEEIISQVVDDLVIALGNM